MNKFIKWAIMVVFSFILLIIGCERFLHWAGGFGGSYPYAESWIINAKESDVVDAIKQFKKEEDFSKSKEECEVESIAKRDTQYDWESSEMLGYRVKLEKDSSTPLPKFNSKNSYPNYWLFVNFYYTDTKQVVHAWTRPEIDDSKTELAFVSISDPGSVHNFKLINDGFLYLENKRQIEKFEKSVITKIKLILSRK